MAYKRHIDSIGGCCTVFIFVRTSVKYLTKPIKKDTIVQYVEASGTIKPINTIEVGTQVSGTVAKIYVDYNDNVKKGDLLAGTRIIPLVIAKDKMKKARAESLQASGGEKILNVRPFKHKKVGILTTGNEVFYGRIKDTFTPVILEKFAEYDTEIIAHETCSDDSRMETGAILRMAAAGADIVVCTGGMSVDPDDRTPLAIRNTGAEIISYGAPVLPGAMFLLAYYEVKEGPHPRTVVIMGLPGCVMYAKRTIFDLVLPHVMADDEVTAQDLAALGEGGLCLNCPVCTFPNCGFGKGH
jgi:hypothetical protein